MSNKDYDLEAVKLLRTSSEAVLTTISQKYEGYPFGSFMTYITDKDRSIIIYASNLAEHTTNIKSNSKSCMTIFSIDPKVNKQDNPRVSLIGDFKLIETDKEKLKSKFKKLIPDSEIYLDLPDFNFYKMSIESVRWIGGFGKIGWLESEEWKENTPEWIQAEDEIISHMNKDHSKSITSTLSAQHNVIDKDAKIVYLNIDGCYVESQNKIYFLNFKRPCFTVEEIRKEFVVQARENREFELSNEDNIGSTTNPINLESLLSYKNSFVVICMVISVVSVLGFLKFGLNFLFAFLPLFFFKGWKKK